MSTHEAYRALLQAFAEQEGLDPAQLLDSEEIVIDGLVIALSQAGAALQCMCEVAPLPLQPTEDLLQLLLQANTLGAPTQGATLGLLGGRDVLVLAKRIPLESSAELVARTCLDLAAMAVLWAAMLPQV